jgi:hypothetical protein
VGNQQAFFQAFPTSRGDRPPAFCNRGPFDIAALAIFPDYFEFDGEDVLRLAVGGAAGGTVA